MIINFYLKTICSTILHTLSTTTKKKSDDEKFVAQLMPYLLKGLQSKCAEYKRATYLILSNLFDVFTFQTNLRDEMLNDLSKVGEDDEESTLVSSCNPGFLR